MSVRPGRARIAATRIAPLLALLATVAAAPGTAESNEPRITPEALRPYVHEGLWETSMTLDLPSDGSGASPERKPVIHRECLTAARAESLLKQCREGEDCAARRCRERLDIAGPHAARIRVWCTTLQGKSQSVFSYRWDSWAGTVQVFRGAQPLMGMRISGRRVGDCLPATTSGH